MLPWTSFVDLMQRGLQSDGLVAWPIPLNFYFLLPTF